MGRNIDKRTQRLFNQMSKLQSNANKEYKIVSTKNLNQSLDLKKETDNEITKLNKTKNKNGIWNAPNFMFNLIIAVIASLIVWIISMAF